MAPQLTKLPGEIRDIIYQYALWDPAGLMLWIDPAGTRRLCRQHVQERSSFTYHFSSWSDASKIEFNQLQYVNRFFWRILCFAYRDNY
ncbi:hypothetical protein EK21DRAFT_119735 [Setomelanomma holmii]|uniref:Uncharacterized protein n=1 Tax=Setomelanomma holmii TaxID=210430 RepID=A0A9P4GUX1_9PLEO|nr:hypothetical protein EK21DRAFT_119735 [Setomelanomma holmii]